MNSQLYAAASGLIVEQQRLDLIANNLANVSTSGHRAQRLLSTAYQRFSAVAVAAAGSYDVPQAGPVRQTGRGLDVALRDGDFMTVETAAGKRYIRGGSLSVSPNGELIDGLGHRALDAEGKPITGLGESASFAKDGAILEAGNELGRLHLVRDPGSVLRRTGNGLLSSEGRDTELATVADPSVRSGWIEGSGTDSLGELVRLVETQRAFERFEKLISLTMNEVNRRAVNDLAR